MASNTERFKTRTEMIKKNNLRLGEDYVVALDIGYSAVKGYASNKIYTFPSYARRITDSINSSLHMPKKTDIIYRDSKTGEKWYVGAAAQDLIVSGDTNDVAEALYGRNRYISPIFHVLIETGIAMGMIENDYDSPEHKELFVQTGLPPAYKKADEAPFIKAMEGHHSFDLKIGKSDWKHFEFTLNKNQIDVIEQPIGTLLSIATSNDGRTPREALEFFNSRLLIFDPGFGTLDIIDMNKSDVLGHPPTFDNLGMKRVFAETVSRIYHEYDTEISIPELQNYLADGQFTRFNAEEMRSDYVSFEKILLEENERICLEAIEKVRELYQHLSRHKYLVITGGTGAAWAPIIKNYFSQMQTLKIIMGNQNDPELSSIYSNVRGYYMYRYKKLLNKQ